MKTAFYRAFLALTSLAGAGVISAAPPGPNDDAVRAATAPANPFLTRFGPLPAIAPGDADGIVNHVGALLHYSQQELLESEAEYMRALLSICRVYPAPAGEWQRRGEWFLRLLQVVQSPALATVEERRFLRACRDFVGATTRSRTTVAGCLVDCYGRMYLEAGKGSR